MTSANLFNITSTRLLSNHILVLCAGCNRIHNMLQKKKCKALFRGLLGPTPILPDGVAFLVPSNSRQDKYKDYNLGEQYKLRKGILALMWWCNDTWRQQYPWLLYMAINILLILAISNK